jgi:Ca-activated chloride channel homolog
MKAAPLALLLAASALALPARWLHNPRERTASAIEEWQRRDYAAADRQLDEALALAGENPRSLFNAGTGRLGAGTPGAALPLLTRAAAAAASDTSARGLRPETHYNLGNAYLAAGDPAAAVESYRTALRLQAGHGAAKHNLELALRQLEKQQQEQQQQQPQGGGAGEGQGAGGGQADDRTGGGGGQGEQPQPQPPPQPSPDQSQQGQSREGQAGRSPRLPGFDPQQDMSADQAASLLEAVENLEREQRRAQAEQQRAARARAAADKDW